MADLQGLLIPFVCLRRPFAAQHLGTHPKGLRQSVATEVFPHLTRSGGTGLFDRSLPLHHPDCWLDPRDFGQDRGKPPSRPAGFSLPVLTADRAARSRAPTWPVSSLASSRQDCRPPPRLGHRAFAVALRSVLGPRWSGFPDRRHRLDGARACDMRDLDNRSPGSGPHGGRSGCASRRRAPSPPD